jgi:uncharacterized protein YceK
VRTRCVVMAVVVALALSGCGTICNLAGGVKNPDQEPRVYGGVQRDFEAIGEVLGCGPSETEVDLPRTMLVLMSLGAIDPVFSFVGDTLTLPIAIHAQNERGARAKKTSAGSTDSLPKGEEMNVAPRTEKLPEAPPNDHLGP